ncbi:LPS translocon maturation chaperone LptM [Duodenibacillus massiliensis]|nr:unknown [Sutterella sp. CAG:397]
MLRTIVAIVCLATLTACGLKGPLYLSDSQAGTQAQTQTAPDAR